MTLPKWLTGFARGAQCLIFGMLMLLPMHGAAETKDDEDDEKEAEILNGDAQKAALNQLIVSNRVATRRLRSLKQFLAEGNLSAAADTLNQLGADQLSDSLFWNEQGKLVSTLREARAAFADAGPGASNAFELRFGVEARNALQDVERSRDYGALAEVGRRYFFTAAGFLALEQHGTWLLDSGYPTEAAQVWRELVRSPAHRQRVTPRLVAKTAAALKKAGLDTEAVALLTEARKTLTFSDADWQTIQRRLSAVGRAAQSPLQDWSTGFGDSSNSAIASGSVPYLQPRWSRSLETAPQAAFEEDWQDQLRNWERGLVDQEGEAMGVAALPLVVGEQVIARDFRSIVGMNLKTGSASWRYRSPKSAYENWLEIADDRDRDETLKLGYLNNAANGLIASDGQRVFAINTLGVRRHELPKDKSELPRYRNAFAPVAEEGQRWLNQLVCIKLPDVDQPNGQREIAVDAEWKLGAESGRDEDRLEEHVFLGPPLPIGDSVYVITENAGELTLVRIQSATGQVLRMTRLCVANGVSATLGDELPELSGYIPAAAGGVIVCPTEAGMLVAVDSLFGEIQWVYPYLAAANFRQQHQAAHPWVDAPHIWLDSVVYLCRHGNVVHCLDLKTGTRRWAVGRDDAKYVGTITDEVVVLIGDESARGISRKTGATMWTTKLGVISGRGVAIESTYVVPLKSGGVASLEIATGKLSGFEHSLLARSEAASTVDGVRTDIALDLRQFGLEPTAITSVSRPGNLIAHRDAVVSIGPRYLTVFTQARARQMELANSRSARDQLVLADIDLTLNDFDAAEARLVKLSENTKSSDISAALLRTTHREVTLARLNANSRQQNSNLELIEQLSELSVTPAERAQAAAWRVHGGLAKKAFLSAGIASRDLARTTNDEFVAPRDRDEYVVRSSALARRGMLQAFAQKDGIERRRLEQFLKADLKEAQQDGSLQALMQFADLYASSPEAVVIRNQLADRLIVQSKLHEAESYLLANQRAEDPVQRVTSGLLMVCLLAVADLPGEASRTLEQLLRDEAEVDLSAIEEGDWKSFAEWFDFRALRRLGVPTVVGWSKSLRPGTRLAEVFRQRQPLEWRVENVRFNERGPAFARPVLNEMFHQTRRLGMSSSLDVDVFSRFSDGDQFWCLSDRLLGIERGRVELPTQLDIDFRNFGRQGGHMLSAGSMGYLNGISLLDATLGAPQWKLRYPPAEQRGELIEIGPTTGRTSIFFSNRHLFAVESATGRVRWRRSDINLPVGLAGDLRQHIFADETAMTVFQPDGMHYTTLMTQTGEVVRRGRCRADANLCQPVPLGRKLAFVSDNVGKNGMRSFRIWDPLTDKDDLAEPFAPNDPVPQALADGRVALVKRTGRVRVFATELAAPEVDMTLPFDAKDVAAIPHVFIDGEAVYVNVRRDQPAMLGRRFIQIQDAGLTTEPLHYGSLYAVDRRQQVVLWKRDARDIRTRSVVKVEVARLPFLVTVASVQPQPADGEQSLEMEAIDRSTGALIGQARTLIPCRLVHVEFDRDAGRLSFYGLTRRKQTDDGRWQTTFGTVNRIDLEFSPPKSNFAWRAGGSDDVIDK